MLDGVLDAFLRCWMHLQGCVLANTVLDIFSGCWMGCWMHFHGVGCIERVVFWPTRCWMHFQGVGCGVGCFSKVLDALKGLCFGQHRVGCIFRVLDGVLGAFFKVLDAFSGCWMGCWMLF